MNYRRIISEKDPDIPLLQAIHRLPEISRYISIDEERFWRYVVSSENVYYYKVYQDDRLIGATHCEISERTLYLDLMVIPACQKCGVGTCILHDIQAGTLPLGDFDRIEVSIDETNTASIRLFEKMGFRAHSKEAELVNYVYEKAKTS